MRNRPAAIGQHRACMSDSSYTKGWFMRGGPAAFRQWLQHRDPLA